MPTGPVHSVSFSDMSSFGREIAHVFGIIGMTGGIMTAQLPADNPEARRLKQLIQSVTRILMKLGPVLQKIDFFSSSASTCTVDGHIVRQESVLTYKPPPPPSVEGEEKSTAAAVPAH